MKLLTSPSSGSAGGVTASFGRGGQVRKSRRPPVQPIRSQFAAANRGFFAASSSAWSTLTPARQRAWAAAADSHPRPDSLGVPRSPTGKGLFIALNTYPQFFGLPAVLDPPRSWVVFAPRIGAVTSSSVGSLTVELLGGGSGGDGQIVFASPPESSGRSSPRRYSVLDLQPGNFVGVDDITAAYITTFGVPTLGTRVWFQVRSLNSSGALGTTVNAMAVTS